MKNQRYIWIFGLLFTSLIVVGTIVLLAVPNTQAADDPWANVPVRAPGTSHANLIKGPLETGQAVTQACLVCHEDAAAEMMQTVHWTWQAPPVEVDWRDEPVSIGKANTLNNFCIGALPNIVGCSRCHAGYGWQDSSFFTTATETDVDCLVCHDQSGFYVKGDSGLPVEGVDLVASAQSVGLPTRVNCGGCHFNGGGGNGVKHGDLDESLYFPSENLDIHMGSLGFQCIDCHQSENHNVKGRSISVSVDNANQIFCTNCHTPELIHEDDRINTHLEAVACQTCHVPQGALKYPTKVAWDWSAAGDSTREESAHEYLKIKGSFVYESDYMPGYYWFNGTAERYLLGDPINTTGPTVLNQPRGDIDDPTAQIWPFKVHVARQPYDADYNILLLPSTSGDGGYWTTFDWGSALEIGSDLTGLPYSGNYGFAETEMFWPLSHMVQPGERALQCADCHSENGRMDWEALGYFGDPMTWGSRKR